MCALARYFTKKKCKSKKKNFELSLSNRTYFLSLTNVHITKLWALYQNSTYQCTCGPRCKSIPQFYLCPRLEMWMVASHSDPTVQVSRPISYGGGFLWWRRWRRMWRVYPPEEEVVTRGGFLWWRRWRRFREEVTHQGKRWWREGPRVAYVGNQ